MMDAVLEETGGYVSDDNKIRQAVRKLMAGEIYDKSGLIYGSAMRFTQSQTQEPRSSGPVVWKLPRSRSICRSWITICVSSALLRK